MYLLSTMINDFIEIGCSLALAMLAVRWMHKKTFDRIVGLFPENLCFIGYLLSITLSVTTFVLVICISFWIFDGGLYKAL